MSIKTATHDGVATIEIARPEKKNAITIAMYQAMADALNAAQADASVRAVLITGQPGIFTSGNDIEDFMQRPPSGAGSDSGDSPVFQFMRALIGCEKPVIAAVTGAAIGIGTTMLLHCDLVYVSDEARLAMPFVSLGLVPEFTSSVVVPDLSASNVLTVSGRMRSTIEKKMSRLIPFPMPRSVICSPSHMTKTPPVVSVSTVVNRKKNPGVATAPGICSVKSP